MRKVAGMKLLRVYIDTSVIGGCRDKEFSEDSQRVMDEANRGVLRLLVSELVLAELGGAPGAVQAVFKNLPRTAVEVVPVSPEVVALRDAYLEAGILLEGQRNDATHVAAATVARADAIVSWNFRHIVRLDKIRAYNQVNLLNGYGILTILTPREVNVDEEG